MKPLFAVASLCITAWWLFAITPQTVLPAQAGQAVADDVRFAVIGDYGSDGQPSADVAKLVKSWNPDFIITTGDNNYPDGAASTIDANIGRYYHTFIAPYPGSYGAGSDKNRFFPSLGNHDWDTDEAKPYFDYFTLPGNERYYDFTRGPVHFFAVDSDPREPDGTTGNSPQANWLHNKLEAAPEPWKIVYFHESAYSSGEHGSNAAMQWPFAQWGVSAILSGHDHDYERLIIDGLPYFVDGLGGRSIYGFGPPISGSVVRYAADYGAMLVQGDELTLTYRFVNRGGKVIDTYEACARGNWHPGTRECLASVNGGRRRT